MSKLPNKPNNTVFFNDPEKAIINDRNKMITLIELHPSMIRETY